MEKQPMYSSLIRATRNLTACRNIILRNVFNFETVESRLTSIKPHILENIETFKELCDNAPELVHIVEPDGTIVYANNAWTSILGYTQREVLGKSILSVVYPADRNRYAQYRQSIMTGVHGDKAIGIRMLTKTDSAVDMEGFLSAKVIEGITQYTQGFFRVVTARVQQEQQFKTTLEKLKERLASLEQLFLHAPDAIIVADTNSIIRYWNPKAEQIFGWPQSEVLGKSLTELIIPSKHRETYVEAVNKHINPAAPRVLTRAMEITALRKGEAEFTVSMTISTTRQNNEQALIVFVRDNEGAVDGVSQD
jgi:two-component system sensor kinase FixL